MKEFLKYELNLPKYQFNIKKTEDEKLIIFDDIRKKYVALTPEEWVRQNFVKYLISEKNYSKNLISVEMQLYLNKTSKRCDIVVFNKKAEPKIIVECKAPEVAINQKVFEQIMQYNIKLKVDYLIVTNGIEHYCCKVDYEHEKCIFLTEIPNFEVLNKI